MTSALAIFVLFLCAAMNIAQAQGTGSGQCYFGACSDGQQSPPKPAPRPNPPAPPARQEGTCIVADPTGTPLNVRQTPQGVVVSTLQNGARVRVVQTANDYKGQPWAYVVSGDGREQLGWVIRRFIAC